MTSYVPAKEFEGELWVKASDYQKTFKVLGHMTKDDALRLAQRALSNKNAPARVVYEALAAIRKVLQEERR